MRNLMALLAAAGALAAAPSSASADHSETLLICGSLDGYTQSSRPTSCFLDWPDLPLAQAVNLRRITWTAWGARRARGRAITRTKTYDPWTHVTLLASGRRHCATIRGTRVYVYTRVSVTFGSRGSHAWRLPGCSRIGGDD